MVSEMICKRCYKLKGDHIFNKPYYDCPIYFKDDPHWTEMIYKSMDNLEYLEWLSR